MTTLSYQNLKLSGWQTFLLVVLAFWLSSSLLLDGLIMPTLYASGMMLSDGFAAIGYSLFWMFNRVELLCAGCVLTAVLLLRYGRLPLNRPGYVTVVLGAILLAIAAIDTYVLMPQMSALGMHLSQIGTSAEFPQAMNQLHISYWILELLKLSACGALLWLYHRILNPVATSDNTAK